MNDFCILDYTVPFYFEYENIKIYENSWNRLTEDILIAIDCLNPKTTEELLKFKYEWSKQDVFSKTQQVNFTFFKGIYLNTNHSATRAFMNIKYLLTKYNVDLSKCILIIRKHPAAENIEVKTYYRNNTIEEFTRFLQLNNKSQKTIDSIIRTIETLNKVLKMLSTSFNDFFLFENEYYLFQKAQEQTLEKCKRIYYGREKNIEIAKYALNYLEIFYRKRDFYKKLSLIILPCNFKETIENEINYLFDKLNTEIITSAKLYSRMCILHSENMQMLGCLENEKDFYTLAELLLRKKYFFNNSFITRNKTEQSSNEKLIIEYATQLDIFSISDLNTYIEKMRLQKLDNYLNLMKKFSNDYVQIDEETMIKKDKFLISKKELNQIEKELLFYVNSFGKIKSKTFVGYSNLPNLSYKWNKYLLLGIVNTFFRGNFIIRYIGKSYKTIDFSLEKGN